MSKYIYRKQTPLKWNAFLKFFALPVNILAGIAGLYSIVNDIFLLHLPHAGTPISSAISILGGNMQALGDYFWPVTGYVIYYIVLFLLTVLSWIGLLKWREYGPQSLVVRYILMLCWYLVLCYFLTTNAFMVLMSGYAYLLSTTMQSIKTISVVAIIFGTIITLLELLLTWIYYHKRKPLFDTYYQQPYELSNAVQVQDAEQPAQLKEPEAVREDAPVQEDIAEETSIPQETVAELPAEEAGSEETSVQEAEQTENINMEVIETVKKVKTNFCPNCGTRIEDEKMRFCPNCGRAL